MRLMYLSKLCNRKPMAVALLFCWIGSFQTVWGAENKGAFMSLNEKILSEKCFDGKGSPAGALYDSLQLGANRKLSDTIYWQLSYDIALGLRECRKHALNIRYISEALTLLRKMMPKTVDTEKRMINLGFLLFEAYQEAGLWGQALDLQYQLLAKALKFGLTSEQAVIYNNISSVYYSQKDYWKTIEMLLKAVEINERNKDKDKIFVNYNNLSTAYVGLKEYEKAIEYAFLATHSLSDSGKEDVKMLIFRNIGAIYIRMNELSMAEKYLSEVKGYQEKNKQTAYLPDTYKLMGDLCVRQNRIGLADDYYKKAMAMDDNKAHLAQVMKAYSAFCRQKGDLSAAYVWLDKYMVLQDSLSAAEDNTKLTSITDMYLDEQKWRTEEAEQIISLRRSNKRMIILLAIIALSVIVAVYWLFGRYGRKKKAYEKQISEQARTLMSVSLDLMQKDEFIASLAEELIALQQNVSPQNEAARSKLRSLVSLLLKQGGDEKKSYFEEMNLAFYNDLLKKYPSLTSRDLRLCGLIRLGLSTKEIADITCKEVRSVESARNRLRKKCNLSQQVDLFKLFNQ